MRTRALFVSSLFVLAACNGADPVAACENYADAWNDADCSTADGVADAALQIVTDCGVLN